MTMFFLQLRGELRKLAHKRTYIGFSAFLR